MPEPNAPNPFSPRVSAVPMADKLAALVKEAPADEAELVSIATTRDLTRFAENIIHQNVSVREREIYARCVVGKRVGVASTSDPSPESVKRTLELAAEIARTLPPDERFPGLPQTSGAEVPASNGYVRETADCAPELRADGVTMVTSEAASHGGEAAGIFETASEVVHVANSHGVAVEGKVTTAELAATMSLNDKQTGWAQQVSRDVTQVDPHRMARVAAAKMMLFGDETVALETGKYAVILEPAAVGQLLLFLGFMGFGAATVAQHRSFLKQGEKICGENITIRETPLDAALYGLPVDYEGTVRRGTTLVEKGIAGTPVSNHYYAQVTGGQSTGHALPPSNSYGPYPKHLVIEPGTASRTEMMHSVKRGILITHFWYVNFLNPMRTMVTGTTRDGTFLIEDGELTARVVDMRMEQSILEALSNVRLLESTPTVYRQYSVMMSVPGMVVDDFNLVAEG